MSFVSEFKQFAMRGNVVDLAVGVVIGAAFGKIVDSLVKNVIMPPIGALLGGIDFSHYYLSLTSQTYESMEAAEKAGAPLIKYGAFLQSVVDFTIIAFAIFMMIKVINRVQSKAEEAPAAPPPTPEDIVLLREIRDALKK
jgi:large conductance mechanosensitive channel